MKHITVEVAYALPKSQTLIPLQVPENSSVIAAIQSSGILEKHSEIDLSKNKVGIFGKSIKKIDQHKLEPGDRVEIYRPLIKRA